MPGEGDHLIIEKIVIFHLKYTLQSVYIIFFLKELYI